MKIRSVYELLDEKAPFSTAAEWDNCGLSVGSLDSEVSTVLLALDVTKEVIDEAKKVGAQLVLTHHPLIFNPQSSVMAGSVLYSAVMSGKTFIASHTCLDKALGGVNDCLSKAVGIFDVYQSELDEFLKVGTLSEKLTPDEFAALLKQKLGGSVRYNCEGEYIKKVAFCSGSGGEFCEQAKAEGADALLTGDASHHEFLSAAENGISLFAAGHYETEVPVLIYLKNILDEKFGDELSVIISKVTSPIITY